MKCGYCGSDNAAEDLRCHLCGRRMSGPMLVPESFGNTAPRLEALEERLATEDLKSRQPVQTRLFPVQEPKRVIPFESISPDAAKVARSTQQRNAKARTKTRGYERAGFDLDDPPEIQKELSFPEEHMETRTVERALYTNAPVAIPSHRAMAVAYDMAMISIGVGILITIYYFGGVKFGLAKLDLSTYAVVTACVALLYKVLWALSGGDTPRHDCGQSAPDQFRRQPPQSRRTPPARPRLDRQLRLPRRRLALELVRRREAHLARSHHKDLLQPQA